MTIKLPRADTILGDDDHALMHRVVAIDSQAPEQSIVVNADGSVSFNNTSGNVANAILGNSANGTELEFKTIIAGTNITITHTANGIEISASGGGGSSDHASLSNLDYAHAGHTGFQPALGYTPYNATNPAGYISGIDGSMVVSALGYTPYSSANPSGYINAIDGSMVTTALGFTPYNATNPAGYITSSSVYWSRDAVNGYIYPTTLTDKIGFGTITPQTKVQILSTTEQLRLNYNTLKYNSFTTTSTGILSLGSNGTTNFKFGNDPGGPYSNIWAGGIAVPDSSNYMIQVFNDASELWLNAPTGGKLVFTINNAYSPANLVIKGTNTGVGYLYTNPIPCLFSVNGTTYIKDNLGIGTTNPGANLDLGATVATNKFYVYNNGITATYGLGVSGTNGLEIYTSTGINKITFGTYDQTTFTPKMVLDTTGLNITGCLKLSKCIELQPTTDNNIGVIKKWDDLNSIYRPWLHNYGLDNLFVGTDSGNFTTTGYQNTGIGYSTLFSLTTGYGNLCFGYETGGYITNGFENLLVGAGAGGIFFTSGNNMICIGKGAGNQIEKSDSFQMYIGDDGYGIPYIYGNFNTYQIGIFTTTPGSSLSILGNSSIGSSYSALVAPTDGLIVEGFTGIGTDDPISKFTVNDGDIEVEDLNGTAGTSGVILTSPNGTRYRIKVSDLGILTTSAV